MTRSRDLADGKHLTNVDSNTLVVDAANDRVGIGTSSPSVKFEVNNGGAGSIMTLTDGVNTNFNFTTSSLLGTFGTDAGSTSLALKTSGTERMRVDNNGNVGIGTTPASGVKLQVKTATDRHLATFDNSAGPTLGAVTDAAASTALRLAGSPLVMTGGGGSGGEHMRVDTGGAVRINTTANQVGSGEILSVSVGSGGVGAGFAGTATDIMGIWHKSTGGGKAINFFSQPAGNNVGNITLGTSSTAYNTSSDYRLKQGVEDMTGAIDRVKALAPKRFQFIADADTTVDGFLAHEAQTVVPEAVTGTHNGLKTWTQQEIDDGEAPDGTSAGDSKLDEDGNTIPEMQGIDQSKLVPLLTGALQEAIAKIETLETKVAALEAE